MIANVGSLDKSLRVILGIGLLSLTIFLDGNTRWFGLIGILPLATVLLSWCPAYAIFGIKTIKKD